MNTTSHPSPTPNNYEIVFTARDNSLAHQDILWSSETTRTIEASSGLDEVRNVAEMLAEVPDVTLFVIGD